MHINDLKNKLEKEINRLQGQVALSVKFLKSNEEININEKTQFWAASVIKVPIACEFFRQVETGIISENSLIKITTENFVDGSGVLRFLNQEAEYTLVDLVKLMLILSDNSATNQVVDLIGWENVEKYMQNIGMLNSTFRHKMMIKAGRGPNLTTAEDLIILYQKLFNNELVGTSKIIEILKCQQDRRRIPLFLPNNIEIAHKTGSLEEAMHDTGIIYSQNPFIFVFLSDDQKDKRLTNDVLSSCTKLCFDYSINE